MHVEAAGGEVVDRRLLDAEVQDGEVADPLDRGRGDLGRGDRDGCREVLPRHAGASVTTQLRLGVSAAASPEKIPPRMLPAERMWRVTARVSIPLMPTTPSVTSDSSSDSSERQFETTREGSRTM